MWSVSASHPHCHAQFSSPPPKLLAGQWSHWTSNPPSHNVRPRWLAAVTGGRGWGVPDGEACCRMGLLLSIWAMSQVITSTHLIHHAPQMDTNKEDTFLPPLPLPHSSPLSAVPSLCEPRPAEKDWGAEFKLCLALGGHESARRKRQVVFWLLSLGVTQLWAKTMGQLGGNCVERVNVKG